MATLELTTTFTTITCASCAIQFAVPAQFERELRRSHEGFWCPRGHSLTFNGESDLEKAERLRKLAEKRQGYAEAATQAARDQAQSAEYARRAQKAANTRLKNRIAKGICPCCKRNFANIRDHIAGQHPDFVLPHE